MNRHLPPAVVQERVTVRVKWFNPTKGFGFVVPEDQDGNDAFLHASVLPMENASSMAEGTTLVDLARGQKGLMVASVYSVDVSTAVPPSEHGPRQGPGGGGFDGRGASPANPAKAR